MDNDSHVLVCTGHTVRELARSGLMCRDKLGLLPAVAAAHRCRDASAESPADEVILMAPK